MAQERKHFAKDKGTKYYGIDVARFGDDKSCFTELIEAKQKKTAIKKLGPVHTRTKKTAKKDLMETTGDVIRFLMDDWEGEMMIVGIDATGLGSGVYDRLVEIQKSNKKDEMGNLILPSKSKLRLVELHYGNSVKIIQKGKNPTDKEKLEQKTFLNVKALMYDDLNKALKEDLRLRKDSTYNAQLPTIKYTFNSNGKMQMESKKDYKKRTGKPSPDESDSLAMANLMRRFQSYGDFLRKMVR